MVGLTSCTSETRKSCPNAPLKHSFCLDAALGDPEEALGNVEAAHLKAFFQWMIENSERTTPQVGTVKQYFRVLKVIYKRDTGVMLDEELVADVNAVSDRWPFSNEAC